MRNLILTLIILIPSLSVAQEDHLLPTGNYFSLYKHERDYYLFIYKHLLENLSDAPIARVITLPSFSPENVLSVEAIDRDKRTFKVIYQIGKESIWSKEDKDELEVLRYETPIDTTLATLIGLVFKAATSHVRYLGSDSGLGGLDGVTYVFSTFVLGQGIRAGEVWSPEKNTKMNQLVEFSQALVQLATADNEGDKKKFAQEIKEKGGRLLKKL